MKSVIQLNSFKTAVKNLERWKMSYACYLDNKSASDCVHLSNQNYIKTSQKQNTKKW